MFLGWFVYYAAIEAYVARHRYNTLRPMAARIKQLQGDAPVYLFADDDYSGLIYYYGSPMPPLSEAQAAEKADGGQTFLLVAKNNGWQALQAEKLCVVAEYRPFLRADRAARIYGSGAFCREGAERKPEPSASAKFEGGQGD
jgi:hypothetical protein